MQPIDLRSDTVTRPTQQMRAAMTSACVGDDVMGEDPTVIALEERAAEMFGKEAALFVASGTMANLLAILSQTSPGDEILMHNQSHIYYYEGGGYAALAGCSVRFVEDADPARPGIMNAQGLAKALRFADVHFPTPRLLTLENTHNRGGGVVWPMDTLAELCDAGHDAQLRVHTDGARIWNAAAASGQSLEALAEGSDTISACLSKGLGCPVGSLLIGDQATIDRARHKRKMIGGGMRQAGILAAAGLYAFDHHLDRLVDDHRRARHLGEALAQMSIFDFDPGLIETNLVYARLERSAIEAGGDAYAWQDKLGEIGVLCYAESSETLRFVTHLDLDDAMIEQAILRIGTL